jgi:hypothetical protein
MRACTQDLDVSGLATYQQDGEFGCFLGILPAGSQPTGTTGCLVTVAFSWFPHLVVGIQSLQRMQETCFAVVKHAQDRLSGLDEDARNAKRPCGQAAREQARTVLLRDMKTKRSVQGG